MKIGAIFLMGCYLLSKVLIDTDFIHSFINWYVLSISLPSNKTYEISLLDVRIETAIHCVVLPPSPVSRENSPLIYGTILLPDDSYVPICISFRWFRHSGPILFSRSKASALPPIISSIRACPSLLLRSLSEAMIE